MRIRLALLALAATALVTGAAIACGGDDVSPVASSSPSGSAPAASRTQTLTPEQRQVQALLQGAVLKEGDLLPGLTATTTTTSTNQDIADTAADAVAQLAKLDRFGRQLGYDVQFEPGQDAPLELTVKGVEENASLYKTPDGAAASLADGIESARQTDYAKAFPGLQQLEHVEVPRSLGDQTFWLRISGVDNDGRLVIDDQVAYDVGRARIFLRVINVYGAGITADRQTFLDQVEQWANLAAARLQAALFGANASSSS